MNDWHILEKFMRQDDKDFFVTYHVIVYGAGAYLIAFCSFLVLMLVMV